MAGKELQLLKEEERTLVLLHTKLSDQLNRLKVEELALSSMLRLNNRPASSTVSQMSQVSQMTDQTDDSKAPIKEEIQSKMDELETKYQEALDLTVRAAFAEEEEEEEDDDEDDDEPETVQDQLTAFLDELSARKQ